MLRNIARQLVEILERRSQSELPSAFIELHQRHGGGPLSDIDLAVEVVNSLLSAVPRVYIVIDGLDECLDRAERANQHSPDWSTRKLLPRIVQHLVSDTRPGLVKWAFISCKEGDLEDLFESLNTPSIEVTPEDTSEDILTYIQSFCDNTPFHVDLVNIVRKALARSLSTRNFLDARLTLELLSEGERGRMTSRDDLESMIGAYDQEFDNRYLRGLKLLLKRRAPEIELVR